MSESIEPDYRATDDLVVETSFLPDTQIEIIRHRAQNRVPQHALFDFDGTLSLIREGWPEVMLPMMVELLQETGSNESPEALFAIVNQFVMELTGKQTIYQMMRLVEEIKQRGGNPEDPLTYKQEYHRRLMLRVDVRREDLRSGRVAQQEMLVPGSLEILEALQQKDVSLYLASGTDENYVREEVALLGLDKYFEERVYGAVDDYKSFSKAMVIDRILRQHRVEGARLLGFGDGYVEIHNVNSVGGTSVGVASDETGRSGKPDRWKRDRLIGVGAAVIVPDFREQSQLITYLWDAQR